MARRDLTSRFASLRAFHYPDYVRIWLGAFVSNIGTWVQAISLGVWVADTTGKAGWTGTIAALTYLPSVVLGPIGGALADRLDRRRLLGLLTLIQALSTAGLAALALTGNLRLGPIAALVLAAGCASALSMPAFNALLSELVEPKDLLSAVSLASGQFNLARTVGPMLAALLLTAGGIASAFLFNLVSFLAVLTALAFTPAGARPRPRAGEGLWQGIVAGVRVARRDPGIRLALPLTGAVAFLVAPFIGLMPAFAMQVFGRGAAAASVLATAQGLGALVAAFTANAFALRWGARGLLVRSTLVVGPVALAYWLAPTYPLAFAILALLGFTYLWTLSSLSTTCMARVSRDLQARMSSLYSMTLSGGYALGLMAQGWLADRLGLRLVPAAAALLLFTLAFALRQRRAFEAIDAPSPFQHGAGMVP